MVNIVYIVKMEDLLILFVERWFIQMTVEKYCYWLHIVSQGLYHAIVSELREDDPIIQRHQNHQNDLNPIEHFNLDEMRFQHMNMDIGFNFDHDQDENDNE